MNRFVLALKFVYKPKLFSTRYLSLVPDEIRNKKTSLNSSEYFDSASNDALQQVINSMQVIPNFITDKEEEILLKEIEDVLKRIRYEQSHWDDAIHNYRETEHLRWKGENKTIIERIRKTAFSESTQHIKYVHILDIAKDGFIKPHVDSIRFCGDTISGISLLSSSVMRLALEADKSKFVDVLLSHRSLYIMRGESRYKFTHEVLEDKLSYFKGKHIPRNRRISVICRNEPS